MNIIQLLDSLWYLVALYMTRICDVSMVSIALIIYKHSTATWVGAYREPIQQSFWPQNATFTASWEEEKGMGFKHLLRKPFSFPTLIFYWKCFCYTNKKKVITNTSTKTNTQESLNLSYSIFLYSIKLCVLALFSQILFIVSYLSFL